MYILFRSQPQKSACQAMKDNRCCWTRGKVLGGSSVLNTMLYIRGNRRDFDQWESLGNPGWGYESILPYFRKSEDQRNPYLARNKRQHGTGGKQIIKLCTYSNAFWISFRLFFRSALQVVRWQCKMLRTTRHWASGFCKRLKSSATIWSMWMANSRPALHSTNSTCVGHRDAVPRKHSFVRFDCAGICTWRCMHTWPVSSSTQRQKGRSALSIFAMAKNMQRTRAARWFYHLVRLVHRTSWWIRASDRGIISNRSECPSFMHWRGSAAICRITLPSVASPGASTSQLASTPIDWSTWIRRSDTRSRKMGRWRAASAWKRSVFLTQNTPISRTTGPTWIFCWRVRRCSRTHRPKWRTDWSRNSSKKRTRVWWAPTHSAYCRWFCDRRAVASSNCIRKIRCDTHCSTTTIWRIRTMWMWCAKASNWPWPLAKRIRWNDNSVQHSSVNRCRIASICRHSPTSTGNAWYDSTPWRFITCRAPQKWDQPAIPMRLSIHNCVCTVSKGCASSTRALCRPSPMAIFMRRSSWSGRRERTW